MSELYINRELSWLRFNKRVLEEACSAETPLFERLKFVSIFSSNLDEFYMVRVGTLIDQSLMKGVVDHKTQMTPEEQIKAINATVRDLYPYRDNIYRQIMDGLSEYGVRNVDVSSLNGGERRIVKTFFNFEVLPVLSAQIIDVKHPFPHLESRQMYIGVRLRAKGVRLFGIVPLPKGLDRIYKVPGGTDFLLLEDIILYYVQTVFSEYTVEAKAIFRITRNADIELDDSILYEETNYREVMTEMLRKRRRLSPVRLEISSVSDDMLLNFFLKKIGLTKSQCFVSNTPLDLSFVSDMDSYFTPQIKDSLLYKPLRPQWPSTITHASMIDQVKYNDILLTYPYESMRPLIDLISEASTDRDVVSIKMTLYRISNDSQIVRHLCNAAENGKNVTIIIELRARFDEQNNINWSKVLEESGCHVIYGVDHLKVHSKILLITRKSYSKPKYIVNIATGNYNESTARFYTDLSLITTNPAICEDAVQFFNDISIGNVSDQYRSLIVSPRTLKPKILECIEAEKQKAMDGKQSRIIAKMNSLTDKDVIDALISASQSGVEISLIIRSICCLRPGVKGQTDHIAVRSIVGRFLEHSRVYSFGTGEEAKIYIGSADMMTRNTENRVEILTPIESKKLKAQIMDMLEIQLRDNIKARIISPDGEYTPCSNGGEPLDSQLYFYKQAYRNAERVDGTNASGSKSFISRHIHTFRQRISNFTQNNF